MRRQTVVRAAIFTLCIAGSIHEMPNMACSLRSLRNLFVDAENEPGRVLTDRLIASDREAGDILRYCVKNRYHSSEIKNLRELQLLVARYPQNEYLLSRLAEGLAEVHPREPAEALAAADRLIALDPNNAHYRYLRGWILLHAHSGASWMRDALKEFDLGRQTPEFHLPYCKYKQRIDRLAEEAVLDRFNRPREDLFYANLGLTVSSLMIFPEISGESLDELIASATSIVDRVMPHAYDVESLCSAAEMMKRVEQARLKELDLSEDQARQTRRRLGQALATEDLRWHWDDGIQMTPGDMTPWIMLFPTIGVLLFGRAGRKHALARDAEGDDAKVDAMTFGMGMLTALVTFVALSRLEFRGIGMFVLKDGAWGTALSSWMFYPSMLMRQRPVAPAHPRRARVRKVLGYGLFWLNGTLLLMISGTDFLGSGHFGPRPPAPESLAAWFVFCVLLRASTDDPWPLRGRISVPLAVRFAAYWGGVLIAFNVAGGELRCESRIYADPLSRVGVLPTASQETYERVIVDSKPSSYALSQDPHALPEHAAFLAPEDMKAFLAGRRAEGKPLTRKQLDELLLECGRDVRPILAEAIEDLNRPRS